MFAELSAPDDNFKLIESGELKITIRRGKRDITKYQSLIFKATGSKEECGVHVKDVRFIKWGELLAEDNEKHVLEAIEVTKKHYQNLSEEDYVTIVEW